MSNSYNTQDTRLFPSTKVLTGILLQHRGKTFLLPFPYNKQKYAKYENILRGSNNLSIKITSLLL